MRTSRVLFVANITRSRFTGMGRWSHSIRRELEKQGFSSEEWCSEDLNISSRWGRLSVFAAPLKSAFLIWNARKRFDVVVLHEPLVWPSALLGSLFSGALPRIFAVSHGLESRGQQEFERARNLGLFTATGSSKWKYAVYRKWQNDLGLYLAHKVICMNGADAAYLLIHLGRSSKDLILINNGIDADSELPTLGRVARDPSQVLMLSQWQDYKGKRALPRLWRTVLASCPQAKVVLIGTGADEAEVRGAFGVEEQHSIVVLPKVHDRTLVQNYLLRSSIFLMPSIHEGSPLAMIEAMACGLAIVGSNAGGIPDILRQGADGLIFDWGSPEVGAKLVIDLLRDPCKRQLLAERARTRAEHLTWTNAAAPLCKALRNISE